MRSRCRTVHFPQLGPDAIDAILRREAPEADSAERAAAIAAASGSPGAALDFVAKGLGKIHALMLRILREGDPQMALRGQLGAEMGARPDRERLLAALDLARALVGSEFAMAPSERQLALIEAHGEIVRLSAQAPTYNFDPNLLVMEIGHLLASAALPREAVS